MKVLISQDGRTVYNADKIIDVFIDMMKDDDRSYLNMIIDTGKERVLHNIAVYEHYHQAELELKDISKFLSRRLWLRHQCFDYDRKKKNQRD